MNLFLLNLGMALLWTFLSASPSLASFVTGYVLGFVLIAGGGGLFPNSGYVRRMWTLWAFGWAFVREFVSSNVVLIRVVLLRPRSRIRPGFLGYDVRGLTPKERQILMHCITLTPGTTVVDWEEASQRLILHALDAGDPEALRRGIDRGLRDPLLKWTRA